MPPGREFSSVRPRWRLSKQCEAPLQAQELNLHILPIDLNSEHFTLVSMFPVPHPLPPPQAPQGIKTHVKRIISTALQDQNVKFKVALVSVCLSPMEGDTWHMNYWGPTIVRAEG